MKIRSRWILQRNKARHLKAEQNHVEYHYAGVHNALTSSFLLKSISSRATSNKISKSNR